MAAIVELYRGRCDILTIVFLKALNIHEYILMSALTTRYTIVVNQVCSAG